MDYCSIASIYQFAQRLGVPAAATRSVRFARSAWLVPGAILSLLTIAGLFFILSGCPQA